MRNYLTALLLAIAAINLVGCPHAPVAPFIPVIPVNPENPNPAVPSKTGTIEVSGNLSDTPTKSLTMSRLAEIVDDFIGRAAYIDFIFNPMYNPDYMQKDGDKGGGYDPGLYWNIPVSGGNYSGKLAGVKPGSYWVDVKVRDISGYDLFVGWVNVDVNAGQTTFMPVQVDLKYAYDFSFKIKNMPCADSIANVRLYDGRDFLYASYFWMEGNLLHATFPLSLDFEEGTLVFSDQFGNAYQAYVPLNVVEIDYATFDFWQEQPFDYMPALTLGNVDVSVEVTAMQNKIIANGRLYESIQEAIYRTDGTLNIELGEGVYSGFDLSGGRVVSIKGQGPDKTKIINGYSGCLNVINVSLFGGSPCYGMGKSSSADTSAKGGGEASPSLYLSDLSVISRASFPVKGGGPVPIENSAPAIIAQYDAFVCLQNCVVTSEQSACVGIFYNGGLEAVHCIIAGNASFPAIATEDYNYAFVRDSVILNAQYAVYLAGADDIPINANYNVIWKCGSIANYTMDPATYFVAQPLFEADWTASPGSPCIGKADDGGNIGYDPLAQFKG